MEFGLPALDRNMKIIGFIRPGRFKNAEFVPLCGLSASTQERIRVANDHAKDLSANNMVVQIRDYEDLDDFALYAISAWSKKQHNFDIGE